ncbi:ClpP/crotonase [Gonapodya prolifera JEL478]|uniref:ClpP/crotonase n=1 Tax=Gonapodya prolifera (strain JEL478) TaxID=1344416 RepID=A0A139AZL2_GONPJ|nr:ClpP/crotonase [Gonapodya prolifera JEL478]|eukprot:KXS22003.1 ClpP/crotonase [Gonapodya prolifera JEL478]
MRDQHPLLPYKEYEKVGLEVREDLDGRALWIIFNRPTKMNSLSWPLTTALQEICDALMLNRRIRVVIFAGNGRNFSAGLDFESKDTDVTDVPATSRYFGQRNYSLTVQKVKSLSQMTIALVHGSTVGVGFAISCACDVRIAGTSFRCSIGANRMGLSGGEGGLSWMLPRLIGTTHSNELLATHRWMDSQKALRTNLVSDVVSEAELRNTGLALAKDMLAMTASGLLYTKQLILLNQNGVTLQGTFAAEDATQMAGAAEPEVLDVMRGFQSTITKGRSKI